MNEPFNHHYLPVFYLRQWCNAGGKVVRYYRPYRDVVPSPIAPDNTGHEPYLYTLDGYPAEQQQRIEKEYMAPIVDEPASQVLQALLAGKLRNALNEQQRTYWVRFLMSLELRNPTAVAQNHKMATDVVIANLLDDPAEYDAVRSADEPATLLEFMQKHQPSYLQNLGKIWLPGLIENEAVGTIMINMLWSTIDLGASTVTLLTGDRPYLRDLGLKDSRCVIALPMSPRFLFIATHTRERQQEITRMNPTRIAKNINGAIVATAIKQVYGTTDSHLRFIEKRLRRRVS